jgi:hypothetical protein
MFFAMKKLIFILLVFANTLSVMLLAQEKNDMPVTLTIHSIEVGNTPLIQNPADGQQLNQVAMFEIDNQGATFVAHAGIITDLKDPKTNELSGIAKSNKGELIRNNGFELPLTDELSRAFLFNHQDIPFWEYTGEKVLIVNHTRLLSGEGFQSLLLPCDARELSSVQQKISTDINGYVRISLKLAVSKAVDGVIEVFLDSNTVKTIHMAEFWKPEEIALTDQMKWLSVTLPEIMLKSGKHTFGIRVVKFQPRVDRQGDKRDIIQGVLVDAVSVQYTTSKINSDQKTSRPWPIEKNIKINPKGPLLLDNLAGPWVSTRTLACYPSLANFYGALRSAKELGGIQYLHFNEVGAVELVTNAVFLDGNPVFCDESRWYPYQLRTRSQVDNLDIEANTRMIFSDHGMLTRINFTNQSDRQVTHTLEINLQSLKDVSKPDPYTVVLADQLPRAYRFTIAPISIINRNGTIYAQWNISIPAHKSQDLSFTMVLEKTGELAQIKAQKWGKDFNITYDEAKTNWEKRWLDVFTPGNSIYSGCLPTLETNDKSLRELYYLSIVSLLETERDNFPKFRQCFIAATPEWCRDRGYFWDLSLTSLPYALLNPEVMKDEIRHWLTIDWKTCNSIKFGDGTKTGHWYAVNPYAYFLTINHYITTTQDFEFLTEKINGKTVLEYLEALALDWKRLVKPGGKLADIGGECWNMLEAPPDYKHVVASLNAANVWMMRKLADYYQHAGNSKKAAELIEEADSLIPEILALYNKNTGSWSVMYPDGKKIDSRHSYDFLTVGNSISQDLSSEIKTGMIAFVERELMTDTWMRAMSRQDPSAFDSDRSDHGPAGSYSGWPAKVGQATAELGHFEKALDMYHRFRGAFDSAIPQAIELTKVEGVAGLQARVSTRAGASFATVSGSFSEVIINTFFGFRPGLGGENVLWEPTIPRGFEGRLSHVRWKGCLYSIKSDKDGIHMEKE